MENFKTVFLYLEAAFRGNNAMLKNIGRLKTEFMNNINEFILYARTNQKRIQDMIDEGDLQISKLIPDKYTDIIELEFGKEEIDNMWHKPCMDAYQSLILREVVKIIHSK